MMQAMSAKLFRGLLLLGTCVVANTWWETSVMYQVYPRSFQDANGDGTGDLKGIQMRLPYLKELGVGFVWLSPVMKSPMLDFGYDISDFTLVDPVFGSMEDMKDLIDAADKLGIKILMDFVPNHSSNYSAWFQASRSSKTDSKRNWYLWHPGQTLANGTRAPPNNWASNFGGDLGSSWTWDEQTQEYYYHAFGEFQPDLNYHNPEVVEAMHDVLRFWMNMGIGGFRIDAVPFLLEDPQLRDESVDFECAKTQPIWGCMNHSHTQNSPENHDIIRGWRKVVDEYTDRVMFGEIYAPLPDLMTYYGTPEAPEFHLPFNFAVLGLNYGVPNDLTNATIVGDAIRDYSAAKPVWGHGNWVLGNHDNHRLMDRVANDTMLTATIYGLLNLIPGTPTIYNGDELAMRDLFIPYDKCQDPMCKKNPEMFAATGRDPERTPMQWTSGPQAGFSTNPNTWLPINPNHVTVNADAQHAIATSPLSIMSRTLKFRAERSELALGRVTHVPSTKVMPADLRDRLVAVEYETSSSVMVAVANWDTARSITFDLSPLLSTDLRATCTNCWKKVFGTAADFEPSTVDLAHVSLEPGEVVLLDQPKTQYVTV